jgi:hypothetical protein
MTSIPKVTPAMQQNRLRNIVIGSFLSQIFLVLFSLPLQAATANQRLDGMFSLDIQQTLNVCGAETCQYCCGI